MLAERLDDYNDETLLDLILGYLRCCSTERNSGFKLFRAQSLSNMHVDNKTCTLCISSPGNFFTVCCQTRTHISAG